MELPAVWEAPHEVDRFAAAPVVAVASDGEGQDADGKKRETEEGMLHE